MASIVAMVLARRGAGRSGAIRMPVVSRTDVVTVAIAMSRLSGSRKGASGGSGNRPKG
jgi:hypothetical protein